MLKKQNSGNLVTWVVYKRTLLLSKRQSESFVVCKQSEWDELEAAQPGVHILVHAGFASETEAEKHARGTSGDDFRKRPGVKAY